MTKKEGAIQRPGVLSFSQAQKYHKDSRRIKLKNNGKKSVPTHSEMGRLFQKALPVSYGQQFSKALLSQVEKCPVTTQDKVIGKTPYTWIQNSVPKELGKWFLEDCDSAELNGGLHYGYLLEVVLNRRKSTRGRRQNRQTWNDDTIPLPISRNGNLPEEDNLWTTIVLYLPHASIFYTAFHHSKDCSKEFTILQPPMPVSWLRLHSILGTPAKGSLIKSILKCVRISRVNTNSVPVHSFKIFEGYQIDDYELGAPVFPPDVFQGVSAGSKEEQKVLYNNLRDSSSTFRKNCRRYIRGAHHKLIPDTVFIFDHKEHGNATLKIKIRNTLGFCTQTSFVQVVSAVKDTILMDLLSTASEKMAKKKGIVDCTVAIKERCLRLEGKLYKGVLTFKN